jgi:hypothetical protein
MKPSDSAEALDRYLQRTGGLENASLNDLILSVIQFYTDCPASSVSDDAWADMLLFQYGCYDWGDGEMFELDLTRQFIIVDEEDDDAISQLHFTAYFKIGGDLRAIGSHDRWCKGHGEIDEFRCEILNSPAFILTAERHRAKTIVTWENV